MDCATRSHQLRAEEGVPSSRLKELPRQVDKVKQAFLKSAGKQTLQDRRIPRRCVR
jgi:hypothetical protein